MKVNFKHLATLLLPTFLRKALASFVAAFSAAMQTVKKSIDNFFSDLNYHISVTPQVFSLEKMLNDKCDPDHREIRIIVPELELQFYFSVNSSATMQYFNDGNFFSGKRFHDFTVLLPIRIKSADMTNYVTALLNKYKLLTKTFKIEYV